MHCSAPGFPVLHHLLEFAQIHVSIESVMLMLSNHLILCHSLLLPSIFPSIGSQRVRHDWATSLFPASGSFPMSWLFASGGQSIEVSASVLPVNIHGWFPLELTSLISFLSKGLSRVFSSTSLKASILQCCFLYSPNLTSVHDYWKNRSFDYMDLCQQSDVSAFLS